MVKEFMNFRYEEYPFELFSVSHVVAVIVSFGCMIGLYVFRDRLSGSGKGVLKWLLVVLLVLSEALFQVWYLLNDQWDVAINLPFQLCSISLYLCTIMLITKNYRIFEISFFASMTGAFIAIVTPELFFGFPHFRYFQFFLAHLAIVISCLYMVWIEGFTLTFRSMVRAFIALNLIAVIVFMVNRLVGANYMFLSHKPYNASPIDYLGEYPYYLLALEGVAVILFSLLYLPFYLFKNRKSGGNVNT
ncbi:putative integral membrane protein (TIGR02206 family) [Rossellomorea aquimaris]|uniref:Putative integral membrane protein (TIGR02206 family) n=2 Tax=Rossellomorea aquimaris TaxID=189382 RepID=A0A366EW54_9BACI|nr:putative integral membrane protein (TIGR02206 family) [Rossellomorea aquimaris]